MFALVGIVGTLIYQARETRRAVQESRRQAMSELLQMAMQDPDLDECWGPIPEPSDPKIRKQQLYINMILTQWSVAYESGATPEPRLRAIAEEMFSGSPGRTFWARARKHRLELVTEGKKARFNRILEEAYQNAVPPGGTTDHPQPGGIGASRWPPVLWAVVGALAAAVLGWLFERRAGAGS